MGDFVEIKLKINGREETVKIEKGVTFENNGARYAVDSNGKLQKQDKKGNNTIWSDASEITMTEYQYSVFCAISDNNDDGGLSKNDIETAFTQYKNGEFKNDIREELSSVYNIESTELKKSSKCVSLDVRNGDSGAKLTFGITENTTTKNTQNTNKPNSHTVKKGETLYGIAKQYGMTVDEIKRLNGLTNNTIAIGKVLMLTKSTKKNEANKTTNVESSKTEKTNNNSQPLQAIYSSIPKEYDSYIKDAASKAEVSEDFIRHLIISEGKSSKAKLKAYYDCNGVLTIGFGHTNLTDNATKGNNSFKNGDTISLEKAFDYLVADIKEHKKYTMHYIGEEKFKKLGKSVQEGLIDRSFQAGQGGFKSDTIKANIDNGYTTAVVARNLWVPSDIRRSAMRFLTVTSGMSKEEQNDAKKRFENLGHYREITDTLVGKEKNDFIAAYNALGGT